MVMQENGGNYQSGWGPLLSVANAVGAGSCGQGESGLAYTLRAARQEQSKENKSG